MLHVFNSISESENQKYTMLICVCSFSGFLYLTDAGSFRSYQCISTVYLYVKIVMFYYKISQLPKLMVIRVTKSQKRTRKKHDLCVVKGLPNPYKQEVKCR